MSREGECERLGGGGNQTHNKKSELQSFRFVCKLGKFTIGPDNCNMFGNDTTKNKENVVYII